MKWKRSKKAALEAKKGHDNNNVSGSNNKEPQQQQQQRKDDSATTPPKDGGNNAPTSVAKATTDLLLQERLNGDHDVSDDDDDVDMDDSDVDEDDVIDVADDKQMTSPAAGVTHGPSRGVNHPFLDQSSGGAFVSTRDVPTDLSVRAAPSGGGPSGLGGGGATLGGSGPSSLATSLPQPQHVLSRV